MLARLNELTVCRGCFVLCVLLNLAFSSAGIRNSLQEIHVFRQLQTATTARYLQEEGFSFAYPTPLFGPPWSVPMEFPSYQLCVAQFGKITGLPLEVAGRVVALGFLYLSLPAFFALAGYCGLIPARRWLLPGLILLSPAYIYYSRSFMIESTALCFSAWFLLAYCRSLERRSIIWAAVGIGCGVAAAVTKVTTAGVFLVVAALFTLHVLWRERRLAPQPRKLAEALLVALGITVPVIIAGTAWVRFADHVKASNPLTAQLVSSNMREFNFGTWAQRLTPAFWERIYSNVTTAIAPSANLVLVLVFACVLGRVYRTRTLVLLAGFVSGPAIFANLYAVHDYYFYASGVFLLAALVLAWSQILDLQIFSPAARASVIACSFSLQLLTYAYYYRAAQTEHVGGTPELATLLAATTRSDDVIVIFGQDWESRTPYYAHRRAVMVTDNFVPGLTEVHAVLDRLEQNRVGALVVTGSLRHQPEIFSPLLAKLDLDPVPTFASDDTYVHLKRAGLTTTLTRLDPAQLRKFSLTEASVIDHGTTLPRRRTYAAAIDDPAILSMMSPRPTLVVHPFALAAHEENKRPAFNAHAPTDIIFTLAPGPKFVRAEFGMSSMTYTDKHRTEGVEFRVEWVPSSGQPTEVLYSTFLSPTRHPEDRGIKTIGFDLPAADGGQLFFRTLPGPTGSIAFAWAYWSSITIE